MDSSDHISDHDLERRYLGMITSDDERELVERHLLACTECAARAAESDDYVDTIRAAMIKGDFDLECGIYDSD